MAYLDSADLLARCQADAQRPSTDEDMSSTQWYSFLTEAQTYWVGVIAARFPEALVGVPTQLSTADSGLTYTFPTEPIVLSELTAGKGGTTIWSGQYASPLSDFTWEGPSTIRMARNAARTFNTGLWGRWVAMPGVIDGSTQPTISTQFRLLLVPRACIYYATRGGYRDPQPYRDKEQALWAGSPALLGDTGILGMLESRNAFQVANAGPAPWWRMGLMNIR